MRRLIGDQDSIGPNLYAYIQAFSPDVRDIFERQVRRTGALNRLPAEDAIQRRP